MTDNLPSVKNIRQQIITKYLDQDYVINPHDNSRLIELLGVSFIADESSVIREPNTEYIKRELEWYFSKSRSIYDMYGKIPKIWKDIASREGYINSNYGWCIWSDKNGNQYENVKRELQENRFSRRGAMIYNRPTMHQDYCQDGMNDFICTFANTFFIRNDQLISHYIMRSNDAVFGYNNDYAWADQVHQMLSDDLGIKKGPLIWTASTFHVYERHFKHIDELLKS